MMDFLTLGLMASQFLFKNTPGLNMKDVIKDPMQLICMLKASPEKAFEFYKSIIFMEQELQKLVIQDRENARKLQTSAARRFALLGAVLMGIVLCLLAMQKTDLSKEVFAVISTLAGILGACLKDIYSFEFGSSSSSASRGSLFKGS